MHLWNYQGIPQDVTVDYFEALKESEPDLGYCVQRDSYVMKKRNEYEYVHATHWIQNKTWKYKAGGEKGVFK